MHGGGVMRPAAPLSQHYDLVIVGGGLVGASLALALEAAGVSVAVVEPAAADSSEQPSFDARTVALTYDARRIYAGLGVWDEIAAHAETIAEIHISERGGFGMTHLSRAAVGTEALGYVVAARVIGRALHRRMRDSDAVALHCPATAERARRRDSGVEVGVSSQTGQATLNAALVVLADGGRSPLAAQVGIRPGTTAYRQCAIVSAVETDCDHRGRAFERFTAEGPLALLPYGDKRYAVVWSTALPQAAARMALADDAFVDALQTAFGDRAGNFSRPAARARYALHHGAAARPIARRAVSIGNAAHLVHPVAGQGFNLGLRDAAALAAVIGRARRDGRDLGGREVLEQYAALRRRETARVSAFTDGLIRVFGSRRRAVRVARNVALAGIECCPPAKRLLLRRTMGMAGRRWPPAPGDCGR